MKRFAILLLVALTIAAAFAACSPPKSVIQSRTNDGLFRLLVDPSSTEVYVDGAFVGKSGKYDGNPGLLQIASGTHRLELRKDGYQVWQRDVYSSNTIQEIRVTMTKVAP
jgi:hypothetical protein